MALAQLLREGKSRFVKQFTELAQARNIPVDTIAWAQAPESADMQTLLVGSNGKRSEHLVRTLDLTDPQRAYLRTQHIESILDAIARAP
jgi:hypothetical protein